MIGNFIERMMYILVLFFARRDLKKYLTAVERSSYQERAISLVFSTEVRFLYKDVFPNFDTIISIDGDEKEQVALQIEIARMIKEYKQKKHLLLASSGMVWLHTLRACYYKELREDVILLWKHFSDCHDHINKAYYDLVYKENCEFCFETWDCRFIPNGFTINPV